MGVMDLVCRLLCILVPCCCSSGLSVKDAVWKSVASTTLSGSASQQQSQSKDARPTQRIRKRWASSPKATPGMGPLSPQMTPIEKRMEIPSMTDMEACMPEMSYFSRILSTHQVSTIFMCLPPRIRLHPWTLLFSLSKDGCSLGHLYNRLASFKSCTVLLVIQDSHRHVFGALLSPPNIKLLGNKYSGTGETFLYTFNPAFIKYNSTGENIFFVQGMMDCLVIGGWKPAIWLDENLEKGSSGSSNTFDNEPLTDENFLVKDIECWALDEEVAMELRDQHPNLDHIRSENSIQTLEVCNTAYNKWKQMEECRYHGQFKFDDLCGSPLVEREDVHQKRKAFEEEAVASSKVKFHLGDELRRTSMQRNPSFSDLTPVKNMTPDWTRSINL